MMTTSEDVPGLVPPGEGEGRWIGGERIVFKVRGAESGGAMAILEDTVQPGYSPPLHIHLHENEVFYVLDGDFSFTLEDRTFSAPPCTTVTVPKGRAHTFQNVGNAPGKLLAVVWPAVAFEGFVAAVGTPEPPTGPPDLEKLLAAAEAHGIVVPMPE